MASNNMDYIKLRLKNGYTEYIAFDRRLMKINFSSRRIVNLPYDIINESLNIVKLYMKTFVNSMLNNTVYTTGLAQWEIQFVRDINKNYRIYNNFDYILDIYKLAKYLKIKRLLSIITGIMVRIINGKKSNEIRKLFHIISDFNDEEINLIELENKKIMFK